MSNKTLPTLAHTIKELERAYNFFLKHYQLDDEKYKDPIITISPAGRKKAYGWYGTNFWKTGKDGEYNRPEINISAEHLARDPNEILETLIHEMAHLKNAIEGKNDCNAQQYHNKHFKVAAEFFGLAVDTLKGKGYAITNLGAMATEAIAKFKPDVDAFAICRIGSRGKSLPSRYISINIDRSYEEDLDKATDEAGLTRKELFESLLEKHLAGLRTKVAKRELQTA